LDGLQEDIVHPMARGALLEALKSLRQRSMIESSGAAGFTLQSVIMEYVTDRLIEQMTEEIDTETIWLFGSHALIKTQVKDYVRESQVRLILTPVTQRLLPNLGKEGLEKRLKSILRMLREADPQKPNYAAGNTLNLLVQLGCDLHGYDFSHLVVWQAYLRGVTLPEVNFSYADLATSIFTDTFGSILSVAFSPNGERLVAGTANGEIRLWQVPSGMPLLTFKGHTDWVRSVAFSLDGKVVASGSQDQTVLLWDVSTGQCLKTLQGHTHWIRSVAFSPDRKTLASGSEDQTVRLWDISMEQCLKVLQGHTNRVNSVAFSSDRKTVASGSDDRTVRLWDINTGQCLNILQGHTNRVWSVTFSPDEKTVASGSEDGTIKLWDIQTAECLKTLRSDRPYERMNVTGMMGLTKTQKATLRALGAVEDD
jgi:predicted NACHT family NTPase